MLILIHIPPENRHIQEQNKFGLEMANRSLVGLQCCWLSSMADFFFKYLRYPTVHVLTLDLSNYTAFRLIQCGRTVPFNFQCPELDRIFVLII